MKTLYSIMLGITIFFGFMSVLDIGAVGMGLIHLDGLILDVLATIAFGVIAWAVKPEEKGR